MAASLRRLGYRASAFGNHELDFGRDQYDENRAIASLPYLAANLERIDGKPSDMAQPYVVVRRRGASIGVIGIATVSTPETAAAHRFSAVRFADPTETLARVVPEVWETGVDAIVLLAHECHDVVGPMVRAHPEWKLSFVGTGHCHRTSVTVVDGVPVIGPDWRLEHYARVHLRIDRRAPSGERARLVHYELVDVASPSDAPPASIDPAFDAAIADWSQKVEEQLGEVIGYAKAGLARDSQALGAFIVESWRERFEADVALTTDGAIRQELPAGPIRVADIYSILPFENQLVVCTVPGSELAKILAHEEAIFTGVRRDAKGLVDANGGPIDPARRYRLVTTDFLFSGGDGFRLSELDDRPTSTKVNWREPVIAWTRAQKSSEARPLETVLSEAR
jgi:2',3'-cyclic-nucleotide 2'-phosphodiesterase (5'-nucleotidase family)